MNDQRTDPTTRERIDDLVAFVKRQVTLQWIVIATLFLLTAVIAAAVGYTFSQQDRERVERINESCAVSERKQRDDIVKLRNTYEYLLALSPRERREPLNQAIAAQLGNVEAEARSDDAPSYCDEPNVGLPEPDLRVPKRPAGVLP